MSLFDKLAQRGTERLGRVNKLAGVQSPQTIISNVSKPPTATPTAQPTTRMAQLPTMGQMASSQGTQKRYLADLPANVQLQGIAQILSGQESSNQGLNNFVKTLAAQGKSPEEIRLAFIEQQKNSPDPLVIL